jgi:beta-galactosidase beta subunit
MFFFPDDLHMPCVQAGESSKVKKVVESPGLINY